MNKLITLLLPMVWLVGCASGQSYPYPTSASGQVAPTRYPLDYPLCYTRAGGGTVIAPLRIRMYSAGIPDPVQVVSLRKRDPKADGCFADLTKPPKQDVELRDWYNTSDSWIPLDTTGRGYFSSVAYLSQLMNSEGLKKEQEETERAAQSRVQNVARFGKAQFPLVKQDEVVVINGASWRHRLIAMYNATDASNPSSGGLTSWQEIYDLQIDDAHVLRRVGRYNAMVVADPEWIGARRSLLRRMVEAVRIEKLTQAEVDAAVADYERRRAE